MAPFLKSSRHRLVRKDDRNELFREKGKRRREGKEGKRGREMAWQKMLSIFAGCRYHVMQHVTPGNSLQISENDLTAAMNISRLRFPPTVFLHCISKLFLTVNPRHYRVYNHEPISTKSKINNKHKMWYFLSLKIRQFLICNVCEKWVSTSYKNTNSIYIYTHIDTYKHTYIFYIYIYVYLLLMTNITYCNKEECYDSYIKLCLCNCFCEIVTIFLNYNKFVEI